jgi:hypothetical protein
MLEIGKADMFGPRGFYAEKGGDFRAKPEMVRLLEDFRARAEDGNVRTLSEAGLSPTAYYDAAKRFIDVQVDGNLGFRRPVEADPQPSPKYAKGEMAVLSNGVRGASDFKVHWLGWEGVDFTLTIDLGKSAATREISLSTLSDERSWILHPDRVTCSISSDGVSFREIGTRAIRGGHQGEEAIHSFSWTEDMTDPGSFAAVRHIRFRIEGTKHLPDWHPSAGGLSWAFVDEIVVR